MDRVERGKVVSVILAGGEGTRLRPLTIKRCKPAVSFGGRYRLIDVPLSNSLNSQINDIFVLTQYLADPLHQHIEESYKNKNIEIFTPDDSKDVSKMYRGTADAVRKELPKLLETNAEYFLILSGDQLYTMPFTEMVELGKEADLVIATKVVGEREAKRMGIMKVNSQYEIHDFYEKPQKVEILDKFSLPNHPKEYLGSMGIYLFKRKTLIDLLAEEGDDFGKDLIPKQVAKGTTRAYLYRGYWEDVGTIASFYEANLALLMQHQGLDLYDESCPIFSSEQSLPSPMITNTKINNSLIGQGTIIKAKEISGSIVGARMHVGEGTVIRDSILLGDRENTCKIGPHCKIEKAIIDEGAHLGQNVQLINRQGIENYDGDGIYIRDGIIIVTNGKKLPDHFIL